MPASLALPVYQPYQTLTNALRLPEPYCCSLRRAIAVVCGAASVAVIMAEATISPALPNLSLFSRGLHALQGSQTATEIFCFATLIYPIAAAYYGLYKSVS